MTRAFYNNMFLPVDVFEVKLKQTNKQSKNKDQNRNNPSKPTLRYKKISLLNKSLGGDRSQTLFYSAITKSNSNCKPGKGAGIFGS